MLIGIETENGITHRINGKHLQLKFYKKHEVLLWDER